MPRGRKKSVTVTVIEMVDNQIESAIRTLDAMREQGMGIPNVSLGLAIVRNMTPAQAAERLTNLTGRDISVRKAVYGRTEEGQPIDAENIYYIAEDHGGWLKSSMTA